jgi:hypothetical protein
MAAGWIERWVGICWESGGAQGFIQTFMRRDFVIKFMSEVPV